MGRPRKLQLAYVLERIFFVCRTGTQWCNLCVENGSYKTIFYYFNLWSKQRVFEDVHYEVTAKLSCSYLVVDTSFVKNVYGRDLLGRNRTDRGRNATLVSLCTNERGTPLAMCFHRANKSDQKSLGHLLQTCKRKLPEQFSSSSRLYADKGYDSRANRSLAESYGLTPVIPRRNGRDSGKQRYVVEQTFGLIDQFRRLRVRYERTLICFKSFHFLACTQIAVGRM